MTNYLIILLSFICLCSSGQPSAVKGTFKPFYEKVYLHTDREQYSGGEDVWYKAYLVDGQSNRIFNSSNNLYVELIGPDSKIAERRLIRLDKGLGKGDFKLGDSIVPGTYRIRAYTNWMRNFGNWFFFEKFIQVYSEPATIKSKIIEESRYAKIKEKSPPAFQINELKVAPFVAFFPEGGSLIEGVTGMLAFKVSDPRHNAISFKAVVQASSGEIVTEISTLTGTGVFMFTPLPGEKYTVNGTYGTGETFSTALPLALLHGFSMHVKVNDSLLTASIASNQATVNAMENNDLLLVFRTKGKICYSSQIKLTGLEASLNLPKSLFPPGITTLTLYDYSGKPYAERLIYIDGFEKSTLQISLDKQSYKPKEKVTLTVRSTGNDKLPVKASMSIAVVDAGLIPENDMNILSWLNLQSEVKGRIGNPASYFDPVNPNRNKQLDLLLLTQGWRDFAWKRLADSTLRISYQLEQGITVSGKVKRYLTGKPIINANITLFSARASGNKLFFTQTDSTGRFYLDNIILYGRQLLKINSKDNKGNYLGVIVEDSVLLKSPSVFPLVAPPFKDSLISAMASSNSTTTRLLAQRKQSLSDTIVLREIVLNRVNRTESRLSLEQFSINDNFRKNYKTVMHFLLAEPGSIGIMHDENSDQIELALGVDASGRPARINFVLKNYSGVRPSVKAEYYALSMDKVEKIEVERVATSSGTRGMVYLTVKPNAFDTNLSQKILYVTGYYETRIFYVPKYEVPTIKPDFRTTIHWEPDLVTNEKGEATVTFYNADPKTKIRIVAEGITEKGIPIVTSAEYEVK